MTKNYSIHTFAFINIEQITSDDIDKLINAKPTPDNPVVYRAGLLDAGLFVQISEEEDIREKDFANYSSAMKKTVEWAACRGALYLMLTNDC